MPIINPLPFTLVNGTLADATQVMADFNAIVTDVNNNATSGGTDLTCTGTGTLGLVSATPTPTGFFSPVNDKFGEIIGGAFVPKNTGNYLFIANPLIQNGGATTGIAGSPIIWDLYANGARVLSGANGNWPFADSLNRVLEMPFFAQAALNALDVVQFYLTLTFTGTAPVFGAQGVSIRRIA